MQPLEDKNTFVYTVVSLVFKTSSFFSSIILLGYLKYLGFKKFKMLRGSQQSTSEASTAYPNIEIFP